MKRIAIVGGGYAGFYAALGLERELSRSDEAEVILIDPRPYMTYQPFLPEVLAGSIEARHTLVSLRKNLPRTHVISGSVVKISHANRSVIVRPHAGDDYALIYDVVVVTAGAVTRLYPVAGLKEGAIGIKHVEEAIAIRNRLLASFDRAANLPVGNDRKRLLTVVVVGGGFSGVEAFGELFSLAVSLLGYYPELKLKDLDFRLVEAASRLMPEVSVGIAARVTESFERRGAHVHLSTQVVSAVDGHVVLSTGEQFDAHIIIWAAGNGANHVIAKHTDLPVDSQGFLVVRADLRVGTEDLSIDDAWGAGDDAGIPDLSGDSPTGRALPNAQNAVRQGRLLATNIVASLRGRPTKQYRHRNLGTIATLGMGRGAFESGRMRFTGFFAWLIHRAYHVYAIPTLERKVRVLAGWCFSLLFGRDIVSVEDAQHPRSAFVRAGIPEHRTTFLWNESTTKEVADNT